MIVKCLKCGSPKVILKAKIDVKFQFADKGGVVLVTDVADDIYWSVEYEGVQAVCECTECGHHFSYDEWRESLEQKSELASEKSEKVFVISKAVFDGLKISGKEYFVDDNGEAMKFSSMVEAKKFLASCGLTDMDEFAMGIKFEEVPK